MSMRASMKRRLWGKSPRGLSLDSHNYIPSVTDDSQVGCFNIFLYIEIHVKLI
mgnify:CR=1 FL=1